MSSLEVTAVIRDLMITAVLLAAPPVLTSLIVGLIVSMLQTVTSIQEQTLSFVPRLLTVGVVLAVSVPWTIRVLSSFSMRMWEMAAGAGR